MAIVLDALASYIQSMLTEMATEQVHMLLGVPNEMNKMGVKLRDLKKFLADADTRNITDETVQGWVKELRGAMYDATDILDLCQLKAMERSPSRDKGCFNPLLLCMRNPFHAHDIGSRLRSLNDKLEDIVKRGTTFKFVGLSSYENRGRKMESSRLASRETTGEFDKLGVVGEKIEEDTRYLVELLTSKGEKVYEGNKVIVFAIVGAGGIGKTTLAQKIFGNDIIKKKFDKKIWLSVNQSCSETELLRRAIEAGGREQACGNTRVLLEQTLVKSLEGCTTLLVMDDVWNHKDWEDVLKIPLTNALAGGSCVLVTTRDYKVAQGMMAEKPYHHIEKLQLEDAWSLLKKQVIRDRNDEACVDAIKDIGMGIVEKCDGLPLAVKVMGGLLRHKRIRRSDWENVLKDSTCGLVSQMAEELNYVVHLSYQDLASSLKPCFLYFSLLPKSEIFHVDDIIGMWISEGLVHGNLDDDLERIGQEYYDELILRNLIEPNIEYVDQFVCSMHDVVRSFAHYVARDEALVAGHSSSIIGELNSQKFIRLSLEKEGSDSNQLEWMSLQAQTSLRTLISIGNIKIKPSDSLIALSCLRTLYVQYADFDKLSESLVQLKHLRYLFIADTNTSMLPDNIHKMKFLQYINLCDCESFVKLPGSIGKLPDLRFLNLCGTSINNVPRGFGGVTNLRKLYGFPAHMDGDRCSLEELGPLSRLTHLSIYGLENVSSASIAKAKLDGKVCLSYLRLVGKGSNEDVFNELCPPSCIENLTIIGYFGQQLPRWMMSTVLDVPLGSLRILSLEDLQCCTELSDGLYQLPYLEFLQIKNAPAIKCVGPVCLQQHHGEHLRTPESLGSGLKLEVIECSGLESIGNMPKLQELTIINCQKLKALEGVPALQRLVLVDFSMQMLPKYPRDVNSRHLMEIYCDISLLSSIAAGKSSREWDKFGHIKQVKAYADDDNNNIERKWYLLYTRDPFSFKTNISHSAINQARSERIERVWLPYKDTCPIEEEWAEGCAYADKRQPLCQRFRCNAYRRLVFWLREACLHCKEARRIADSSDQWTEEVVYDACTHITLTAQQFARPRRA